MNRAELVEILASKNGLSKTATNAVLETLIDTIQAAVKKGAVVQLAGFGAFKSVKRAARVRTCLRSGRESRRCPFADGMQGATCIP